MTSESIYYILLLAHTCDLSAKLLKATVAAARNQLVLQQELKTKDVAGAVSRAIQTIGRAIDAQKTAH